MLFAVLLTVLSGVSAICGLQSSPIEAIAVVKGNGGTPTGYVSFKENPQTKSVHVEIHIEGLTPGKHGFHIHEKGDLSKECLSTGGHYNPDMVDHGAPSSKIRHIGDLGNVIADEHGIVTTSFEDALISLSGERSIIGRGVVVHTGEDDLGLGGHADSKKTGNAGGRVACGVIGLK